jgi:hypothetical protein
MTSTSSQMNIDMEVEWIPIKIWSPVKLNRKLNNDSIKTETIIVGDNFEKITFGIFIDPG